MPVYKTWLLCLGFIVFLGLISQPLLAARVKDIAYLKGSRSNQLIGFSLVIGLNGTGDSSSSLANKGALVNALQSIGIFVAAEDIQGRSVAAVMVTATLPPFAKQGNVIDVVVSAIGDAITLQGGTLLMTPLRAANRQIFAVAQGTIMDVPRGIELPSSIEITGYQPLQLDAQQNYLPTVGRIINGATIERELDLDLNLRTHFYLVLKSPDFTTADRIVKAINYDFSSNIAKAEDAGLIEVSVPPTYLSQTVELISKIENLQVIDDSLAKVVIDERTGTVIIGDNVQVDPVAISMDNISLLIRDEGVFPTTSYIPQQLAEEQLVNIPTAQNDQQLTGQVLPVPQQEKNHSLLFTGGVQLKEIVDALNKIGVNSRSLIDILKNIKAAGALNAELIIR